MPLALPAGRSRQAERRQPEGTIRRGAEAAEEARTLIAGKLQNSRNSLLRASRETDSETEQKQLTAVTDALVRHDYVAALTSIGLDPFMGFLHVDRPNRPSLALDLTEEFRPWLADRLAITLINRQQISPEDFLAPEGGTVELTDAGRKRVIKAYQERKQETYDVSTVEKPGLGRLRFVGRLAEIGYKTRALGLPGRCGELVFAVDFTSLSDVPSVHWALAGTGHLPAATEGRSQTRREFSAAD